MVFFLLLILFYTQYNVFAISFKRITIFISKQLKFRQECSIIICVYEVIYEEDL